MTPAINEMPIDARIDQIARRQTARFLHRLRQAGECTPGVERDYVRSVRFICDDIKATISEHSQEAHDARISTR